MTTSRMSQPTIAGDGYQVGGQRVGLLDGGDQQPA
jgi:hypothetical protein